MDKSAPWTIAKGTLMISAVSATATGISSIFQRRERLSSQISISALNSAITATTFFSLREFVVSPVLVYTLPFEQYERRRREFGIEKSIFATQGVVFGDMNVSSARSNKLLDSAVSGAITGGILHGIKTGVKGALQSSVYVGAVCMLLQLGYNEFGIQRIKYLSRSNSLGISGLPTTTESLTASNDSHSWKEKALGLIGVRRMTDEERLERMKLQREQYIRRIEELERKHQEERNAAETAS